jgi:tRNA(adenine34) deaminase
LENTSLEQHEYYMRQALAEAEAAFQADEVPVGAIITYQDPVAGGKIVGAAHNQREGLHDPTAHAEMLAITQAAASLENWRLEGCVLYVTLEPCPMCAGAIVQARIPKVVYGASDPKAGAVRSLFQLLSDSRLNHQTEIVEGVLSEVCGEQLSKFFRSKRGS